MQISLKTWNQYKNRLASIDKKAAEEMEAYIQRIGGFEDHAEEVIRYAYALASRYGEAAAAAACQMHEAVAEASGVRIPPAVPAEPPDYKEVARAVRGTVKNSSEKQIPRTVGRLVKRIGADTTLKNAERDGAQFAWIPMGDTCAFCLTLASRGWQHMSKNALKNGHAEHIHANCDCQYAIRFDDNTSIEGYDPDKYLEMYENAEGDTPKEKINSMRRMQYDANPGKFREQKRMAYARKAGDKSPKDDIIETGKALTQSVWDALKEQNVKCNPVHPLNEELTTEQIIAKLHGRDSRGRCSSLALAYVGNRIGLDVKDFRSDASVEIFWRGKTNQDITILANGFIEKDFSDFKAVSRLIKHVEKGKEYYLSTGGHTAIIRKAERGYEYLQLQDDLNYGWRPLNNRVLRDRFRCKNSHSSFGIKMEESSVMFDVDSLKDNEVFKELLGYINKP